MATSGVVTMATKEDHTHQYHHKSNHSSQLQAASQSSSHHHQGLYEYTKLCFGVASAPTLFQRFYKGIPHNCDGYMYVYMIWVIT